MSLGLGSPDTNQGKAQVLLELGVGVVERIEGFTQNTLWTEAAYGVFLDAFRLPGAFQGFDVYVVHVKDSSGASSLNAHNFRSYVLAIRGVELPYVHGIVFVGRGRGLSSGRHSMAYAPRLQSLAEIRNIH